MGTEYVGVMVAVAPVVGVELINVNNV